MSQYAIIRDRLLTARIADALIIDSGASFAGESLELPNPAQIARLISPVALFKSDVIGSPSGGDFVLQAQSDEANDWRDVAGSAVSVTDASIALRVEIGPLGAATRIRLIGRNLSGLSSSDFYTLTVSVEGAIA